MRQKLTRHLLGRQVLRSISTELAPHQDRIAASSKRVSAIRFSPRPSDPQLWRWRMEASRISAEQKAEALRFLSSGTGP